MQNPDQLRLRKRGTSVRSRTLIADLEVLIAFRQSVKVKSVGRIGKENLRPHFRVDRLAVNIRKGNAENERTQVIDIRNTPKVRKWMFGNKMCVLTPLVLRWAADAAIHHSLVGEEHVSVVARTSPEFAAFEPSPLRVIFGAQGCVQAAIEDPVEGVPRNQSFGG